MHTCITFTNPHTCICKGRACVHVCMSLESSRLKVYYEESILDQKFKQTPIRFKVSAETLRQINELSERWGESKKFAIIRCIERVWRQELGPPTTSDDNHPH